MKLESHTIVGSSLPYANTRAMKSIAAWAPGVLGGLLMPIVAWAQERPSDYWGMHYMWGPWGIGMMLMMLVFWGLVIVALVLGIRWLIIQGREPRADSPLDILKGRYARGELTKEKFEAKTGDIA